MSRRALTLRYIGAHLFTKHWRRAVICYTAAPASLCDARRYAAMHAYARRRRSVRRFMYSESEAFMMQPPSAADAICALCFMPHERCLFDGQPRARTRRKSAR